MVLEMKGESNSIVLMSCHSKANVLLVQKFSPENKGKDQKEFGFKYGYL